MKIRKLLRILHRDFGYFIVGMTIVYGLSGIYLNHRHDFNPDYRILITEFQQTKEFALDGVTAITFKNKDSYDLANKINIIFQGKINISKIIDNNYKQTIINHDLDTLKNDLKELFKFD